MSIPINILNFRSEQLQKFQVSKLSKLNCVPLDADLIFNSTKELEDYIRNNNERTYTAQVVLVNNNVYTITKIGDNPKYHKLQTKDDKIKTDEEGNISNNSSKIKIEH